MTRKNLRLFYNRIKKRKKAVLIDYLMVLAEEFPDIKDIEFFCAKNIVKNLLRKEINKEK